MRSNRMCYNILAAPFAEPSLSSVQETSMVTNGAALLCLGGGC